MRRKIKQIENKGKKKKKTIGKFVIDEEKKDLL